MRLLVGCASVASLPVVFFAVVTDRTLVPGLRLARNPRRGFHLKPLAHVSRRCSVPGAQWFEPAGRFEVRRAIDLDALRRTATHITFDAGSVTSGGTNAAPLTWLATGVSRLVEKSPCSACGPVRSHNPSAPQPGPGRHPGCHLSGRCRQPQGDDCVTRWRRMPACAPPRDPRHRRHPRLPARRALKRTAVVTRLPPPLKPGAAYQWPAEGPSTAAWRRNTLRFQLHLRAKRPAIQQGATSPELLWASPDLLWRLGVDDLTRRWSAWRLRGHSRPAYPAPTTRPSRFCWPSAASTEVHAVSRPRRPLAPEVPRPTLPRTE